MQQIYVLTGEEIKLTEELLKVGEAAFAHKPHLEMIGKVLFSIREWEEGKKKDPFVLREEEANALLSCITVFQLILREKKTVLLHRYGVELTSEEENRLAPLLEAFRQRGEEGQEEISLLQKKLSTREKRPHRMLYISDCHFFHQNMNYQMDMRGFDSVEAMNEHMVNQWNAKVTRDDEVFLLGDFSIGRAAQTAELLARLSGRKHLIVGNHDKFLKEKSFDRSLFDSIENYSEVKDHGRKIVLSHYPVFCYKGQYRVNSTGQALYHMLYGHVHNTHDEMLVNRFIWQTRQTLVTTKYQPEPSGIPCVMINCFCMFSDYMPLSLEEWEVLDEKRRRALWRQEGLLSEEEFLAEEGPLPKEELSEELPLEELSEDRLLSEEGLLPEEE